MTRKIRLQIMFALGLLIPISLAGQSVPNVTTQQVSFPVYTLNPTPINNANVYVVGNSGSCGYYYWLVARYTLGPLSPTGPFQAVNASCTLSGSNYNQITFTYPLGISSVDLLRTSTTTPPTGACNCAVATAVTSGDILDQSNSLSSYTLSAPINPNTYVLNLQNEVQSAGVTHLILRQGPNNAFVADLSSGTTGVIAIDTNSTPNSSQTALNFTDTATIAFTNPSGGLESATLKNTAVTPGTYTNATVTFDATGRATSASSGTGGGVNVTVNGGGNLPTPVNLETSTANTVGLTVTP